MARICDKNWAWVDAGLVLPELVDNAGSVILENSKSSVNARWVYNNMAHSVAEGRDTEWSFENHLTFFYFKMLDVLIQASERVSYNNFPLRTAIFSALNELIKSCAEANIIILDKLLTYLLMKINECLQVIDRASSDQFHVLEDIVSNFIISSQIAFVTRKEENMPEHKKKLFNAILHTLSMNKQSSLFSDVYIALSHLCTPNSYFICNISQIIPFLVRDLNGSDSGNIKAAVNLVGDIANTCHQAFLSYSSHIIPPLMSCLSREDVPREIKPGVLSVFGDMGRSFDPYLDMVLTILTI
jgi:importin subunit beta-1